MKWTGSPYSEYDRYLFHQGTHYYSYTFMGGHLVEENGVKEPALRCGLPRQASLGGGRFQQLGWKAASHGENAPVRIWALFIPGLKEGSVQVRDLDPGRTPAAQG